jgi:superfamily II RNA helicase
VVCGTDTLGVGINVPIRTVVFTGLSKYDGVRQRHLKVREFLQIAGRAGRAGFDTAGTVIIQAPDHEVENERLLKRAGDDEKKKKRIVRKKPPEGSVSWSQSTYERLSTSPPEPLTSSFAVTHAMVLNVIARPGDAFAAMQRLLEENDEEPAARERHLDQAAAIWEALLSSGVVERLDEPDASGRTVRLTVDLQANFALNQPLSPFALAAFEILDRESETYALDVLSVVESTIDDPRQVLSAQQFKARGEAVAQMKADGIEYEERMELLDSVTHPKPLEELLGAAFEIYRAGHPWVADHELSPKSVARDMFERAMTFGEYVSFYGLTRSEGLLLRYLSDAFKALRQTVPDSVRTEEIVDLTEWLGELVRQVDSSLLDEWESLRNPEDEGDPLRPATVTGPPPVTANRRAFKVLVRNAMFRRVELFARRLWNDLAALDADDGWDADAWADTIEDYFDEHDSLGTGPDARGPAMLMIEELPGRWRVRQIFDDPEGDHDWGISAEVDLAASDEAGTAVVRITDAGQLSSLP